MALYRFNLLLVLISMLLIAVTLNAMADTPLQLQAYKRYQSFNNDLVDLEFSLKGEQGIGFEGLVDANQVSELVIGNVKLELDQRTGKIDLQQLDMKLYPGINRLLVEGKNASGEIVARRYLDVPYKNGKQKEISGTIDKDTLLKADEGPFLVTQTLTVSKGATLTIEAGTTVYFKQGTSLEVKGTLKAIGKKNARIRLTRVLESDQNWGGVHFIKSKGDNHLSYIDIEYGESEEGLVGAQKSRLVLDNCTLDGTLLRKIISYNSALQVRYCHFKETYPGDQAPTMDNRSEHLKGKYVPKGEQFIFENNILGRVKGHNDVIDFSTVPSVDQIPLIGPLLTLFSAKARGESPVFRGNVFLGGGDDALDMDGSAIVDANLFMNMVRDEYNDSAGDAGVMSGGGHRKTIMTRNIFINVDKIAAMNRGASVEFINNTVIGVKSDAAFSFYNPKKKYFGYGKGATLAGNIFMDTDKLFAQTKKKSGRKLKIKVSNSIVPGQGQEFGEGNISADPGFMDLENLDLRPGDDSPAKGTGPEGRDMGALVEAF